MTGKNSLEVKPKLEAGQADLLCSLTETGLGCSFLPDFVTEEANELGSVKHLDLESFTPDLWKQILYHREKWISPSLARIGVPIFYSGNGVTTSPTR